MNTEKRVKKGSRRIVLILLLIVILIAAAGGYFLMTINRAMSPGSEALVTVEVVSGDTTTDIAEKLEENGAISSEWKFRMKSRLSGNDGKYRAGVYQVGPGMTPDEIMDKMISGDQQQTKLTIPEGYTLEQTAEAAEKAGLCTKEEFLAETQNGEFDYRFMKYTGSGENRLEGFLYPETYLVPEGTSVHSLVDMMLAQFDKIFLSEYYDRAAEMGLTPRDIVTVASMIQRETSVAEEGAKVASVIYNRLEEGMKLQIDATVQYALGEQKARLTYADLKVDSPYNAYQVEGLPAGPICQPHESAIRAALWPEDTDYLFYVLKPDGSGSHNFAVTDEEFGEYREAYISSLE